MALEDQLRKAVRRSDGENLAIRLYQDLVESICAGRETVGQDSLVPECGIETPVRVEARQGIERI